jgi:Skp family chaperone for outer membrane proteins
MRKTVCAVSLVMGVLLGSTPHPISAQTFPLFEPQTTIAVVDQDALFTDSDQGKAIFDQIEKAGEALAVENRTIERELEAEEELLTEQRKTLPGEEFDILAQEFDAKVKQIRTTQAQKQRDLNVQLASLRAEFFEKITPILLTFIDERGIEVLLNKDTVALASRGSDITQAAIQRINELLKE